MLMHKIDQDVISAMKGKKQELLIVLRSLRAVIKNHMIDQSSRDTVLDDVSIIKLIRSEIKKRQDSIVLYNQGGRLDLVNKEQSECDILNAYLPQQISESELSSVVSEVAGGLDHSISVKDMGVLIAGVLSRVGDRCDGQKVSASVKRYIQDKSLI